MTIPRSSCGNNKSTLYQGMRAFNGCVCTTSSRFRQDLSACNCRYSYEHVHQSLQWLILISPPSSVDVGNKIDVPNVPNVSIEVLVSGLAMDGRVVESIPSVSSILNEKPNLMLRGSVSVREFACSPFSRFLVLYRITRYAIANMRAEQPNLHRLLRRRLSCCPF